MREFVTSPVLRALHEAGLLCSRSSSCKEISEDHLALALLNQCAQAIDQAGGDTVSARAGLRARMAPETGEAGGGRPFSAAARAAIERALGSAMGESGSPTTRKAGIGDMLGALIEGGSPAARVLSDAGITQEMLAAIRD